MCGRFNITDSPHVRALMTGIGMPLYKQDELRFSGDIAPGSTISIIRHDGSELVVSDAIWWLMLDPKTGKPDYRYASFNTRSDRLHTPRSLGYKPYRESRCIVPASAFIEGAGDKKTYHKIHFEDHAIAFGGLYRDWINQATGEVVRTASIITLPPVQEWEAIHSKSTPLMLPESVGVRMDWLDPQLQDVSKLDPLLIPVLQEPHFATPIGKVSSWLEIGAPVKIIPAGDRKIEKAPAEAG